MQTKTTLIIALLITSSLSFGQNNDTKQSLYKWKNDKRTELQAGYVILKSGKKLEGQISLNGYYAAVEEVEFVGDGKEITFPVGALTSYGLNISESNVQNAEAKGPISESPESLYEWRNGGVIMNKVVLNSVPREGYLITTSGKRYDGELRVQKRDEELWNFLIRTSSDKEKFKAEEIASYGLTISAEEIEQSNLGNVDVAYVPGTVQTSAGIKNGEIGVVRTSFYAKKILLKTPDGNIEEFTPENATGFSIMIDGMDKKYLVADDVFVQDEFNGNTFQLYRNPNPTTINKFATGLVKTGVYAGTQVAAEAIVRADAKENNYVTNLDSVIRVSSKAELNELRDKLLQIGGYSSVDEMNDHSQNESLNNTVNAIDLAIEGREFAQSDEGIYNQEWIILNKKSGEKTVVYKSDFDSLIEPLLFGCYEFLSLEKNSQKEFSKWKNLLSTVSFLDNCY